MGLLDDAFLSLNQTVSKIQARSQKMLKAYNLSQEIADLKQQKTDQLAAIGTVIYDKYQRQINPDEESLQQKCTEIAALEKDIAHLQKQLDDLNVEKGFSA